MFEPSFLIGALPGIVGLFVYNRWLSRKLPQTGLTYFSILVVSAAPYSLIFEFLKSTLGSEPLAHLIVLPHAMIIAILTGIYAAMLKNKYDSSVPDLFRHCCYLWRKKLVFITLKDSKVYLAMLLDHTGDLRFESAIRIIPICSGYRDEKRNVQWTFSYPISKTLNEKGVSDKKFEKSAESGIIIFQKDIITFSLWDPSEDYEDSPLNREE